MRRLVLSVVVSLVTVASASGQSNAPPACPVTPAAMACPVGQRTGPAAYSLVRQHTQVQTLANGTQITTRMEVHEWHDSAGRTRTDNYVERDGQMQLQFSNIVDPVAHRMIQLHPIARVAAINGMLQPMMGGRFEQRPVDKAFNEAMQAEYKAQRQSRMENKNESLGKSTILGECAVGNRWTNAIPAGEMGNDAPLQTSGENWMAPTLGIQLKNVMDDPRTGHMVDEVTELHVGEPDASVFQPPADYQVFDLTREPAKPAAETTSLQ
ncbi:MAG TPA: hypothetical protein VGU25_00970 [Acidobacteriaceae bacterium]|nr:hypothetical protein [Acidobacteriaceae bacterium]